MTDAQPTWDASELFVKGEPRFRARRRLLQSWYRDVVLHEPPGSNGRRLVGNLLAEASVDNDPTLNFMGSWEVAGYAKERADAVLREGGTVDVDRLHRNLLSSMPLCFNLFGYLRGRPGSAASILSRATGLEIAAIEAIECEWTPPPEQGPYLEDRTAFDSYVAYRTPSGARGFLAIETKYTEPLSETIYPRPSRPRPRYRELTDDPANGFVKGAYEAMLDKHVNQLWRNLLLAIAWQRAEGFEHAHVVLIALRDDPAAERAAQILSDHLHEPHERVLPVALEQLIDGMGDLRETEDWGRRLRRRYVDLAPVEVLG